MRNEAPRIEIHKELSSRALKPLKKMLEMSPSKESITQAAE